MSNKQIVGAEAVARRIVNAENAFAKTLTQHAMTSLDDAYKAMRAMLKLKVAKMDAVGGTIKVKHGAYLDHSAICNAVAFANNQR